MDGKTKDPNNNSAEKGSESFPKNNKKNVEDLTKMEVLKLKIKTNVTRRMSKTKEAFIEGGTYAR